MKYFLVSNSTNLKEVGHYIQCKGIPQKFKGQISFFKRPDSMTLLSNDSFPNIKPNLVFELEEKAILTDVISTSNISAKGLLINQKTKDLIIDLKLAEHRLYPAIVIKNNIEYPYFWLHFVKNDWQGIDISKSILYTSKNGLFRDQYISPNTLQEAYEIINDNQIYFDKIMLQFEFKQNSGDLFFLPISWSIFASQKFKDTMIENKITGISFFTKLNKWLRT